MGDEGDSTVYLSGKATPQAELSGYFYQVSVVYTASANILRLLY